MVAWDTEKRSYEQRLAAGRRFAKGKLVTLEDATRLTGAGMTSSLSSAFCRPTVHTTNTRLK
jgi:hypothetical protein